MLAAAEYQGEDKNLRATNEALVAHLSSSKEIPECFCERIWKSCNKPFVLLGIEILEIDF